MEHLGTSCGSFSYEGHTDSDRSLRAAAALYGSVVCGTNVGGASDLDVMLFKRSTSRCFVGACMPCLAAVSQLGCLTTPRHRSPGQERPAQCPFKAQATSAFPMPATTDRLCAQCHESLDQASGCAPRAWSQDECDHPPVLETLRVRLAKAYSGATDWTPGPETLMGSPAPAAARRACKGAAPPERLPEHAPLCEAYRTLTASRKTDDSRGLLQRLSMYIVLDTDKALSFARGDRLCAICLEQSRRHSPAALRRRPQEGNRTTYVLCLLPPLPTLLVP